MSGFILDVIFAAAGMPAWVGVAQIVAAFTILGFLAGAAVVRRRYERRLQTESLTAAHTWLAPPVAEVKPERSRRGAHRGPSSGPRVVPAHPVRVDDETQVIVPGSYGGDNEETAVLRLNQTPERSVRRG
ncbi:hypothetical protein K1W54_05015 [Micromonospora sp. CPCC 205371]|nr:hypothetical protein [Micromonospora sp. CPCC 205371]